MTARAAFQLVAAAIMALLLFVVVVRPAVERGGLPELAFVIVAFFAILLAERWMRSR